jgi:hypothetical protein
VGVVITRYLSEFLLRREPAGLAPVRGEG